MIFATILVAWVGLAALVVGIFRFVAMVEQQHSELVKSLVADSNKVFQSMMGTAAQQPALEDPLEGLEPLDFDDEFSDPDRHHLKSTE